jgi:hypothetical protein
MRYLVPILASRRPDHRSYQTCLTDALAKGEEVVVSESIVSDFERAATDASAFALS